MGLRSRPVVGLVYPLACADEIVATSKHTDPCRRDQNNYSQRSSLYVSVASSRRQNGGLQAAASAE